MMAIGLFLPAGDDGIAFLRRGILVVTTVMRGDAAQAAVAGMRKEHYQHVLDAGGVPAWDRHDADAIHFVCFADGVPVASMRTSRDSVSSGEAVSVFPDLASVLPDGTAEYLYLSRQLVVPEFRWTGLSAVITHVAAAWWKSHSPLAYAVAASREPTVGNARAMGATVLAGPVCLGPAAMPLLLVGAPLAVVADRTRVLLGRLSWVASPPAGVCTGQ
jgi:hypothetical protein